MLLLPRLVAFWEIASSLVGWQWQFDFDEGHNLNATVLLADGTNIYAQNGPDRFISAPYTPLFYVVNAPFTWLFGPTFGPGRLLSVLSALAVAVLLAYIAHNLTRSWPVGVLAGALWLSMSPVIVWAGFYKQDMPSIALQVAGLAWVVRYRDSNRRYVAVAFFAVAFFTKQSAVTAGAAASLWLLLRDWRTGLRFVDLMAAAIFIPYLAVDFLLNGGLSLHVIGYQSKPWNVGYVLHMLSRLWDEYWPTILAGAGVLACGITLMLSRGRRTVWRGIGGSWGLIGLYTLAAAGWTCIATGIKGGNYNLLLDGLPPLALLAPLGAGYVAYRLPYVHGRLRLWARGGALALVALFAVQLVTFADPRSWYHNSWPGPQQERLMQGLSRIIASTPGDIYSEDDYLLLHNGRPVIYDDPSTFPILAEDGRWDDSVFNQSLRDRRFGLIILWPGSGRFTSVGYRAFTDNYKLADADSLHSYAPKVVPDTPQYALSCRLALEGDVVQLNGYSLGPAVAERGIQPGAVLQVTINWQAATQLHGSYASFVHLVGSDGNTLAARDEPATGSGQPTTAWSPNQPITDNLAIPIPADAPPGRYSLVAGMYANNAGNLTLLKPTCSTPGNQHGASIVLGSVDVVAP